MKKLVILYCVLLIGFCANAQTDCSLYRKGYFMFTDSAGNTILLHRQKNYQYQYDRKARIRTQYRVAWLTECEYTYAQTRTNSKALKKYNYKSATKVLISKTDGGNGYYYTCSCIDGSQKGKEYFIKKITKKEFYDLF